MICKQSRHPASALCQSTQPKKDDLAPSECCAARSNMRGRRHSRGHEVCNHERALRELGDFISKPYNVHSKSGCGTQFRNTPKGEVGHLGAPVASTFSKSELDADADADAQM